MTTKYAGHSFDFDVSPLNVTDAVIRHDHISIDFIEDASTGHLEATSSDGEVYRGTYGYPQLDPHRQAEFRLYRSQSGEVLLFGSYWRMNDAGRGCWLFRLIPVTKANRTSKG